MSYDGDHFMLLQQQIVSFDIDSPGVGVVKYLKSSNPLIEFIGLGECQNCIRVYVYC